MVPAIPPIHIAAIHIPAIPAINMPPIPPAAFGMLGNWNYFRGFQGGYFAGRYSDWGRRFVIVTKASDSITMSGDREDAEHAESLRSKIPGEFIWFQNDDKNYVISDQATVDRAKAMWAPQEKLSKQQEELGKQQEELGQQQEEAARKMEEMKLKIPDLTAEMQKLESEMKQLSANGGTMEELGNLQGELGELQSRIGEVQSGAGREQGSFGRQQGELGRKMGELGRQQGELGRQQATMRARLRAKCNNCSMMPLPMDWRSRSSSEGMLRADGTGEKRIHAIEDFGGGVGVVHLLAQFAAVAHAVRE